MIIFLQHSLLEQKRDTLFSNIKMVQNPILQKMREFGTTILFYWNSQHR